MIALWLFIMSVSRRLRQALPVRRSQATPAPCACKEGRGAKGSPGREAAVTKWDVVMYAIDSTSRTVRLCVLVVVAVLAVLLVLRLGDRFGIEFIVK
jgi:hypothetical protein